MYRIVHSAAVLLGLLAIFLLPHLGPHPIRFAIVLLGTLIAAFALAVENLRRGISRLPEHMGGSYRSFRRIVSTLVAGSAGVMLLMTTLSIGASYGFIVALFLTFLFSSSVLATGNLMQGIHDLRDRRNG